MDKKQQIIEEIKRVANELGRQSLTRREFNQRAKISTGRITKYFGSWNAAIRAAELVPNDQTKEIDEDELLVVFLFGMVSQQLGFSIESIRTGFPDCEGKKRIDKQGRLQSVKIEFEYKSSNFKEHGHNENECDIIICWIHDWKDCPLEVIELKSAIKSLRLLNAF